MNCCCGSCPPPPHDVVCLVPCISVTRVGGVGQFPDSIKVTDNADDRHKRCSPWHTLPSGGGLWEKNEGVRNGETCQISGVSLSSSVVFLCTFFSRQFAWMAAMGRESGACLHQQSFAACLELRKSLHRIDHPFAKLQHKLFEIPFIG